MCEEGWRFVVVDISVVFLHCLVPSGFPRSFIALGLIASGGVSRLLDGVVRVLR